MMLKCHTLEVEEPCNGLYKRSFLIQNAETEFDYRDILTEIKYYIEDELHFLDKPTSYYYDIDWVKEYISLIRKTPGYSGEKNKPKISVVIPSLNSRPYIRECVESVMEQTLKEIEILCVDAGSADGTTEILQEYAKLDKRINIIHSDKQSYGYQINLGIKNAHGDYFAILEPDDYIVPEMYEELYKIAKDNEVEVLKADFEIFTGKNGERKFIYRKIANQDNQYNTILDPTVNFELFRNTKIPWSGLYDMGFIHQKSILLNESPGASFQDNGLWFQTFCQTHRLYYVNKSYYRLRGDNPNSPIYSKGNDLLFDVLITMLGIQNAPGYSAKMDIGSDQYDVDKKQLKTLHGQKKIIIK